MTTIAEAGTIMRTAGRASAKLKLSPLEGEVLVLVCAQPGIRSNRLTELLALHDSQQRRATSLLEQKGLITADGEDGQGKRRGVRSEFTATHKGRVAAGKIVRGTYKGKWVDQ